MNLLEVSSLSQPGVEVFGSLTDAQLRHRMDAGRGIFIAESPKVIRIALSAGYEPVSLLCERRHIDGDAAEIIALCGDEMPVYTGSRELLEQLTGYRLTRGVLCAMRRKPAMSVDDVLGSGARRIVVLDGVVDSTNVGAIFRSAAALGMDGVLLSGGSCDALSRRVIRVSMGTVFLIPWARVDSPLIPLLREHGFSSAAMALCDDSVGLDDAALCREKRLAIIMGSEGDGLAAKTIASADYRVRIPMARGVDSLNVGAAAAVAIWALSGR